ncbi:MAG: ABC transporter substrate-binding protein, partial [Janthinobacterium lividum]
MENTTLKLLRVCCAVPLIAAAGMPAARAAAPEKVVVYQAFQSIQYLPLYMALDKGFFAKNGLDVQKITAGSG